MASMSLSPLPLGTVTRASAQAPSIRPRLTPRGVSMGSGEISAPVTAEVVGSPRTVRSALRAYSYRTPGSTFVSTQDLPVVLPTRSQPP